jgi:elongation factor Tu
LKWKSESFLDFYEFDADNTPIIKGSALGALNGDDKWVATVNELMAAVDDWIPVPPRLTDQPFLMPIEDVFSITGRGTVATGRIERGIINTGDAVDIIGMGAENLKSLLVTGVEMFRKILIQGQAGDNAGLLLRGIEKTDIRRGMVITAPGSVTPHKNSKLRYMFFLKKKVEDTLHSLTSIVHSSTSEQLT